MLKIKNLSKHFGDLKAVDSVSLDIPPADMIGIIGRSGAGKSTLLRLINRLIKPTSGEIWFEDLEITALKRRDLRAWRSDCAMIFQQYNLVPRFDVLTNVLIGRVFVNSTLKNLLCYFSAADRAEAVRILERLELLDHAMQRVEKLSGGQQQRVAIARALMQRPGLILADEPISSLDPSNARQVMEALYKINAEDDITVITNLHSLETAQQYCRRIIGMRLGKIIYDGPPDGLSEEILQEIYGSELGQEQEENTSDSMFQSLETKSTTADKGGWKEAELASAHS